MSQNIVIYLLQMFFLVSSKPTHDIQNFVLINIHPKLHPFSDVKDTALLNIGIYFFAVINDIFIDKLFDIRPTHIDFFLKQTNFKYGPKFYFQKIVITLHSYLI